VSRETAPLHPGAPYDCNTVTADPDDVTECLGTVSAGGGDAQVVAGSMFDLVSWPDQFPMVTAWSADGTTIYFSLATTRGVYALPAAGGTRGLLLFGGLDPAPGVAQPVHATALTFAALRGVVIYGRHDAFTGSLTTGARQPVIDATVTLQRRRPGITGWATVATARTDGSGNFRVVLVPHFNAEFRAVFAAPFYLPSTSRAASVLVRPWIQLSTPSPWRVGAGRYIRCAGAVRPDHHGRTVYLQLWRDGAWRTVATTVLGPLTASNVNAFAFRIRWNSPGTHHYRVLMPPDRAHAAGSVDAWLRVG
jgi:hypothetical protein